MPNDLLKLLKIVNRCDRIYSIFDNRKIYEKEFEEIKNQRNKNVINNLVKFIKRDEESQKLFSKLVTLDVFIEKANEREVPWDVEEDIKKYYQIKKEILERHIKKVLILDELTEVEMRQILAELEQ